MHTLSYSLLSHIK